MCGIAGFVLRDPRATPDLAAADRMTDLLEHRGPDERGVRAIDNVVLGNRRLAIIDLPDGHQPMSSPGGERWITYNGELYNYLELRSELLQSGYPLRTHSDTEVVLALYERHGLEMFERMNGMFAFAIWDGIERQLVLARDRFGEKPLYWYRDSERFAFASEIKAILSMPGVARNPDEAALHEYLTFQHCLGDRTMFEGVKKLEPASYLVLDERGAERGAGKYWTLGFEEDHETAEADYIAELRFLLEDAVKIRLRSDVAVGAYVSGGLDSSIVATIASKLLGHGLPSFTGYFAEDEFSELPYARAVAEQTGGEQHVVCPTADDFAESFRRLIYHMDEPAAGPGAFPQLMVSALAREHVTVALGGQGGDELFGGYARYLIMYLEESIKGSIFESQDAQRHVVMLGGSQPNLAMLQRYVPLLQRFWSKGLFEPVERRYFELVNRDSDLAAHFEPSFLASREDERIYEAFEKQFNEILGSVPSGRTSLFNRMTAYDARATLQALLHVEDRMSMAASLESRLPLLDHRIAELVFRMPPLFKYRQGRAKTVLRDAAEPFIPAAVLDRKDKMGFPVPFVQWARGPLRPLVAEILLGDAARSRGIYRMDAIEQLADGESPYGRELWGLLCLETWFQTFIDGGAPALSNASQRVATVREAGP
jgi:asparagine synthase (glutamine-hydrolysing)